MTERKRLVKKLDEVFSIYIQMRDKKVTGGYCVFGCGRPIQCCFHFITRGKHATRWDELNACASCSSCNYTMEFNPHPFIKWFIDRNGLPAYEALILKSNQRAGFENDDLRSMIDTFKAKIEERQ